MLQQKTRGWIIVGKKQDPRIQNPDFFSGKNSEKYSKLGKYSPKNWFPEAKISFATMLGGYIPVHKSDGNFHGSYILVNGLVHGDYIPVQRGYT